MRMAILPLALIAAAFFAIPAQAQSGSPSQNTGRPFGSFGLRADVDISLAYFYVDQAITNATTVTPMPMTMPPMTAPTTTTGVVQFTPSQLALLVDAKNNLYSAYAILVFSNGNQKPFLITVVNDLLQSGLIDMAEVNNAVASRSFIAGSHPKSNNMLWLALWASVYGFYDLEF